MLSGVLACPVVDMTGLNGLYDFKLEWSPEPGEDFLRSLGLPSQPEAPPPANSNGLSIFTAVQKQLKPDLHKYLN